MAAAAVVSQSPGGEMSKQLSKKELDDADKNKKRSKEKEKSKRSDIKSKQGQKSKHSDSKPPKSKHSTMKAPERKKKERERLDKAVALYAARAERNAKKGQARRKNYFQALDQYQTTVIGGGTTVGGATAINERVDEDFAEKTNQEMKRFLADEKLVETRFEFGKKWDEILGKFKRNPLKGAIEEYRKLEEAIGEDMMNVLSKTENVDGSTSLKAKDVPPGKPPPLRRGDDPAYELQWM